MKDYIFRKDGKILVSINHESLPQAMMKAIDIGLEKEIVELCDIQVVEDERIKELEKKVDFLMEQEHFIDYQEIDSDGNLKGVGKKKFKELYN